MQTFITNIHLEHHEHSSRFGGITKIPLIWRTPSTSSYLTCAVDIARSVSNYPPMNQHTKRVINDDSSYCTDWLISDLIPKKYEKFEFSKIFVAMFLSGQNEPKKTKFQYFFAHFTIWISFCNLSEMRGQKILTWAQNFLRIRTFRIF